MEKRVKLTPEIRKHIKIGHRRYIWHVKPWQFWGGIGVFLAGCYLLVIAAAALPLE